MRGHLSGHVHCVVPGGGLSPDGTSWIAGRATFFLAVKPLAMLFRRLFLERLKTACKTGTLGFFGDLAHLADPAAFASHIAAMRRIPWVVYAKKPFGGPAQVLAYLGRYTHRVAIANSRLVACDDNEVAFFWKDYRQDGVKKIMRLKPDEFIRRFLLHTLPGGFHRIRHFGFMANGHRAARIALCRSLLPGQPDVPESVNAKAPSGDKDTKAGTEPPPCPACGGTMRIFECIPRSGDRPSHRTPPFWCDTS